MDFIVEFLKTYGALIAAVISLAAAVVAGIVSNKSGKCKAFVELLSVLPNIIQEAEKKGFVSGQSKFEYVFEICVFYLASLLNKNADFIRKNYSSIIEFSIENILSAPQKKGENSEEKKID